MLGRLVMMHRPRMVAVVLGLAAAPTPAEPARQEIVGVVFVDRDADGERDAGEPGLAGVAVSDQDTVVVTAADGAFRLARGRGHGVAFVSVPDGYRAVGPFWRRVEGTSGPLAFALAPVPRARAFTFVHASDTHVSEQSLPRLRRLRALVDSLAPAFVLVTGDLVRDALRVGEAEATGYYEMFTGEARQFRVPVWTVPGNHEIVGIERHLSLVSPKHPLYGKRMYRRHLGPDYYSFTHGGVHFVGLNTVDVADLWYYGHVDSLQLAWLERDLALVPPGTPVVTFNHIPLVSSIEILGGYREEPPAPTLIRVDGRTHFRHAVANAAQLLAALRAHRYPLALGGHVHAHERLEYEVGGQATRFHQAAAVVAPSDAAELRFRSGVTLYTVRGGEIDAGRFIPLDATAERSR